MELPYLTFISNANKSFSEFKRSYFELSKASTKGDNELFNELKSDWYNAEGDLKSPLKSFIDSLLDYEEVDGLPNEIGKCLLNNHVGAIEYTKIFFINQYTFINQKEVDDYLNNFEESNDLFEDFYDNGNQLNHADFLKALKIQYIQCILEFEYEFKRAYPFFETRFLNAKYEEYQIKSLDGIGNNIRLNYPEDKKETIIKTMHSALYGPYIDADLEEFTNHFRPFAAKTKMRWRANQTLLVLLFRGKPKFNNRKTGIAFDNHGVIQLICNHFCQLDNSEWDRYKLKKTQDKVDDKGQTHEDDTDIRNLFLKIADIADIKTTPLVTP